MELITREDELKLFEKLRKYYENIHGIKFKKQEDEFSPGEIGKIYYTYPGAEEQATFEQKVTLVKKRAAQGYRVPAIVLRKDAGDILLDGHRRLKAAWDLGISWPVLLLIPESQKTLGIEKTIQAKIRDLWAKE